MGSNLISSVLSGMNASTIGMATAQHNIANAATPGYSRQQVDLASRPGNLTGDGFIGQGVDVTGIKRIYSQFLNTQLLSEQTQESYLNTYYTSMRQLDNLVADPVAGVSPALHEFFSAVNGVSSNPDSVPARQSMLSTAQFAVNRFQEINRRFDDINEGINQQIINSVSNINAYAQQIANLNGNIKLATTAEPGKKPNDLLDQLEQVVNQLNQEIRVTVNQQADGSANVFIGNGQSLVIDGRAMSLEAIRSPSDSSKMEVAYSSGVNSVPLQQSTLQGGQLGAFVEFREVSLAGARNSLGRVAMGMADSLNQQNRLGQDSYGEDGGNLFKLASPIIINDIHNGGNANFSGTVTDVSALTTSDYQLRFDGTNYSTLRLSDNSVTNLGAALPQTIDGVTIDLTSGTPVAGDIFLIKPTYAGAADLQLLVNDTGRIAAAAPMRSVATLTNTGSGKISAGTVDAPPPINSNIRNTVTITFTDPNNFDVFDNSAGLTLQGTTAYDPTLGTTLSFNGWTMKVTGAPKAGDTFTVTSNLNARGDNRNALAMAQIQTKNFMVNGTTTLQGVYGQMVGEVGAKTHQFALTSQAQSSMVEQTKASQQAISGVNLDEEAANLMQYQRAYQAIAKAMQVSNTMFDTLLSAIAV